MNATDVVAYTYQADVWHPSCVVGDYDPWRGVEAELDAWADRAGIDREDETTFDSDDFPKVVFASDLTGDEMCPGCLEGIDA